jgi:hypothetical protein
LSPAVPNANGSLWLYTVSEYSFESKSTSGEIRVHGAGSDKDTVISSSIEDIEPTWLDDADNIIYLKNGVNLSTEIWIRDAVKTETK